jgi:hypothetical protein
MQAIDLIRWWLSASMLLGMFETLSASTTGRSGTPADAPAGSISAQSTFAASLAPSDERRSVDDFSSSVVRKSAG